MRVISTWIFVILTGYCHIGSQRRRVPHRSRQWRRRGRDTAQPNEDVIEPRAFEGGATRENNFDSSCSCNWPNRCLLRMRILTLVLFIYMHVAIEITQAHWGSWNWLTRWWMSLILDADVVIETCFVCDVFDSYRRQRPCIPFGAPLLFTFKVKYKLVRLSPMHVD